MYTLKISYLLVDSSGSESCPCEAIYYRLDDYFLVNNIINKYLRTHNFKVTDILIKPRRRRKNDKLS